jgi:hypothetical protein
MSKPGVAVTVTVGVRVTVAVGVNVAVVVLVTVGVFVTVQFGVTTVAELDVWFNWPPTKRLAVLLNEETLHAEAPL